MDGTGADPQHRSSLDKISQASQSGLSEQTDRLK